MYISSREEAKKNNNNLNNIDIFCLLFIVIDPSVCSFDLSLSGRRMNWIIFRCFYLPAFFCSSSFRVLLLLFFFFFINFNFVCSRDGALEFGVVFCAFDIFGRRRRNIVVAFVDDVLCVRLTLPLVGRFGAARDKKNWTKIVPPIVVCARARAFAQLDSAAAKQNDDKPTTLQFSATK